MFSRDNKKEYDPAQVQPIERPLANGRPLSLIPRPSTPNSDARRQLPSQLSRSAAMKDQLTPRPASSLGINYQKPGSPSRNQQTPTKSSLNKNGRYSRGFDPSMDIYSDEDTGDGSQLERSPHRHAKSVTFDAAPPQINEYEMTTPVPSTVASSPREGSFDSYDDEGDSYEQENSMVDDSFDASLEDTDKTPVVLPEDWHFMSPDHTHDDLDHGEEDPFEYDDYGTPDQESTPGSVHEPKPLRPRVESMDSNGERRPLPPLPGAGGHFSPSSSIMSALERASNSSNAMPSPLRPASSSKADIAGFGTGSMSLEDRLRLMMSDEAILEAEQQRERRLRRGNAKGRSTSREGDSGMSITSDGSERELSPDLLATPPHISRESILRNLKKEDLDPHDTSDMSYSMRSPSPLPLDPDVPIPSLETDDHADNDDIDIKEEGDEQDIDLYDIPEYCSDRFERGHSADEYSHHGDDDDDSRYSRDEDDEHHDFHPSDVHSDGQATPVADPTGARAASPANDRLDASPVSSMGPEHQLDVDIEGVDRPVSPLDTPNINVESNGDSLPRPETPKQNKEENDAEEHNENAPDSPQSVIRHSVSHSPEPEAIPEPIATVKAPGAKTRPSLTPADMETMAATRRKVSGQEPLVPQMQEQDREDESTVVAGDSQLTIEAPENADDVAEEKPPTQEKRIASLVKLDIPVSTSEEGLGFGLDEEFDRVIEAQKVAFEQSLSQLSYNAQQEMQPAAQPAKNVLPDYPQRPPRNDIGTDTTPTKQRGYLMRQNTKFIVATNRPEPPAPTSTGQPDGRAPGQVGVSPRKASQPTWTTEPWNPKGRRQSIKMAGAVTRKKVGSEAVPPLPGQESNAKEAAPEPYIQEEFEDGQERGRVFVKVVGVKNLDLPLPRSMFLEPFTSGRELTTGTDERSYFSLTLDNGLHCVTTSWLELGKSAPIGQEFELVVLNDLEFQLTLQMKLDPPKPKPKPAAVQAKPAKPQKTSAFSRVFASPKKRREMGLKQQMEAQKQQKAEESQSVPVDPWQKVRNLVAPDGSFARAYVSLADYENDAYGRPLNVDVTCFNEWAVDEVMNSVKSKKSATGATTIQRRPPYHIGSLELQLLYVPKPKGATDEDMPKSMNACIREMREADNAALRSWEGFLSQQGGDCPVSVLYLLDLVLILLTWYSFGVVATSSFRGPS